MEECVSELRGLGLPEKFVLTHLTASIRYLKEVATLAESIKEESGFTADSLGYLELLAGKEKSIAARRVNDTDILRNDFSKKREKWRKVRQSLITSMDEMWARASRFADRPHKQQLMLSAVQFYGDLMSERDGAIAGESESTDILLEQYKKHRDEINKIPGIADSLVKMRGDLVKTVKHMERRNSGGSSSASYHSVVDEWWESVLTFFKSSSVFVAEKRAREALESLKHMKLENTEKRVQEKARLEVLLSSNVPSPVKPEMFKCMLSAAMTPMKGTKEREVKDALVKPEAESLRDSSGMPSYAGNESGSDSDSDGFEAAPTSLLDGPLRSSTLNNDAAALEGSDADDCDSEEEDLFEDAGDAFKKSDAREEMEMAASEARGLKRGCSLTASVNSSKRVNTEQNRFDSALQSFRKEKKRTYEVSGDLKTIFATSGNRSRPKSLKTKQELSGFNRVSQSMYIPSKGDMMKPSPFARSTLKPVKEGG